MAGLLLAAAPLRAEPADETYTITGVHIDATASSSAQAREIAIAQGEQKALQKLFDSMVLKSDQDFLPSLDASQMSALVDGISVNNEKVSRTRYLADLTVYFKAVDIRSLLRQAGIAFSETISKPVLILPVLETAGFVTLWTDPSPWLTSWQNYDQNGSHVPFVLPKGGAKEAASISANDVITGDPDTISKLASEYNVTDVYLAYANLHLDPVSGHNVMRVLFMRFGDMPAVMGDDVVSPPGDTPPAQRLTALTDSAVASTVSELNEAWKRETLVHFGAQAMLAVTVPVTKLADWVQVKKQLAQTPVVQSVAITSMTVHAAHIAIKYLGDPNKLVLALAQSDLQLTQNGSGEWVMTSTEKQASR